MFADLLLSIVEELHPLPGPLPEYRERESEARL